MTSRPVGLVDVLDRILDKGLVIAGDIKVSLVSVELLTLKIRLILCSIDKAEQIGLNWWRYDPYLTGRGEGADGNRTIEGTDAESALPPESPAGADAEGRVRALDAPAKAEEGTQVTASPRKGSGTTKKGGKRTNGS